MATSQGLARAPRVRRERPGTDAPSHPQEEPPANTASQPSGFQNGDTMALVCGIWGQPLKTSTLHALAQHAARGSLDAAKPGTCVCSPRCPAEAQSVGGSGSSISRGGGLPSACQRLRERGVGSALTQLPGSQVPVVPKGSAELSSRLQKRGPQSRWLAGPQEGVAGGDTPSVPPSVIPRL